MSTKPKPQPTEFDHVRDTLTGIVVSVGEANSNIQSLDRKVDELKADNAEIREHLSRQDKRFDQLELLIRQLIPNAKN